MSKNINADSVQQIEKEKREKAKEESDKKKEKDKADRMAQKQKVVDRKDNEKKRTQKGEKRRQHLSHLKLGLELYIPGIENRINAWTVTF